MPWEQPQSAMLPDGRRLHLNHGPIDLIIESFSPDRESVYQRARGRFETLLQDLAAELPQLRSPLSRNPDVEGVVAHRMLRAIRPFQDRFVTPMAAVAGAVADEMLDVMVARRDEPKTYVNNGGDVAFHLDGAERFDVEIASRPSGRISVCAADPVRGVATSGWRGRSFSLGIADSVTVVAHNAAAADVAATLIANEVDLPDHPAIRRTPASALAPDSDLGDRPVTTGVGDLTSDETEGALDNGARYATKLHDAGHIAGAVMMLNDKIRWIGTDSLQIDSERERHHA
ncbi:MAG: UPF0280 family protein [Alphaproteobacteria bacterium]|nr:UPF0280 family protein [Alphaproteobacteria bacterium]